MKAKEEENPFNDLIDVFGAEDGERIVELFDSFNDSDCGEDQVTINGLAFVLKALEEHPFDGSDITVPLLAKIQALTAAYHLGRQSNCKMVTT